MLSKFKQQKLLPGPLANQVKKLKLDFDKWTEHEELNASEHGCELLRAASDAYESGRQVMDLLRSFLSVRTALTPSLKIFANLEKPAVQDFLEAAQCSRSAPALEGYLPAEYLETELKILACQALKDEPEVLIGRLSTSVLAKWFPKDAAPLVQRSVQCSAAGLCHFVNEAFLFCGCCCGCFDRLIAAS